MYKFPEYEEVNTKHFFRFEKDIIRSGIWAGLPTASKAIFPVIGVHANSEGVAWPSQETIARMAGITPKTVRSGISAMKDFDKIKLSSYINKRGRKSYRYKIDLPTIGKGSDFRFYRSLVESGFWASLTPGEQAVYPVLRTYAYFEPEPYLHYCDEIGIEVPEGITYGEFINEGHYESRQFEIATPEIDVIAEIAGVCTSTARSAICKLESKKMVYVYTEDNDHIYEYEKTREYLVFIRPRYWIVDDEKVVTYAYLNKLNENITHE